MLNPKTMFSGNDNYETDAWLYNGLFEGWFDPCPLNEDPELDGLGINWKERTFVNPPYSNPLPWVKKAIEQARMGNSIVLLMKHDSSTEWYRLLHEAGAQMLMINGRLKHRTGKSANFPSCLFVLNMWNVVDGWN
jgi:hypothetical protein